MSIADLHNIYNSEQGDREDRMSVASLAEGNVQAFTMLYQKYQPLLTRYLMTFSGAVEHDEIIQDIFLKIWAKREALIGLQSFKQYVLKMARNRLLDIKKSQQARQKREYERAHLTPAISLPANMDIEYKEFSQTALDIMSTMPARQREIYELSVFNGYSLDQISSLKGLSKSVVIKQLYLANKYMRTRLTKAMSYLSPLLAGTTLAKIFFDFFIP